mmetsp:Transcript_73377/g.203720  ORF Transcript_73377/g.203720 Transcript_73377/m.203720 type:complete len:317 (-) Transcript_73377:207-1157(-)
MGQSLTALGCLAKDDFGNAVSRQDLRNSEYLSQHLGHGDGPPTQLALNLRERQADASWLHIFGGSGSGQMVDPSCHKPIRTDLVSFVNAGCGEFCHAICVTMDARASPRGGADEFGVRVREGQAGLEIDHNNTEGEVLPSCWSPSPLTPPPAFRRIRYDWAAPSASQPTLSQEQNDQLQACLESFIRSMLQGVMAQLRLDDAEVDQGSSAQNIDAVLSFSEDLTHLLILAGGNERTIPVRAVKMVRPSDKGEANFWFYSGDNGQLAEVVLHLTGGRFVRLRFARKDQADFFGTCMRLLAKAARGNRSANDLSSQRA